MARTFQFSCLGNVAGGFSSTFILVNIFYQRKKAAKGSGNSHKEKNQQKPRFRIEVKIQEVPDSHPNGYGETHLQADAAESKKLLVQPSLILFHCPSGHSLLPFFPECGNCL
jgi:hypothetical protein